MVSVRNVDVDFAAGEAHVVQDMVIERGKRAAQAHVFQCGGENAQSVVINALGDHRKDGELRQIRGDRLLEIFNGHPTVHNYGGGGTPGMVEVWDMLLAEGKRIYGIAVDDAHHFQGEFGPDRANPGRGWVSVRSTELNGDALMQAMEAGHFYASTGVELDEILVDPSTITLSTSFSVNQT